MEMERSLNSIQWKILRSFLVATLGSGLIFLLFLSFLWLLIYTTNVGVDWYTNWFGYEPTLERFLRFITVLTIFITIATLMVGIVIGFYMGRKLKKSLHSISWAADRMTRGDYGYRITIDGSDEIAELSKQFNRMAERFQNQVLSLQKLIQKNAELHKQASHLAVHEERQRLARELHDSISQQLFAIMMSMAALKNLMNQDPLKAKRQFEITEDIAASAQAEMRALLLHLRPVLLEGAHLPEALEELLTELKHKHPVEYSWDIDPISDIPLGIEENLFRIVQEGISNALRHSQARKIELSLKKSQNGIILKITDNGVGFKPTKNQNRSSLGLDSIRERVSEIGGVFEIISSDGIGTTLNIRVPLLLKEVDNE